MIRVDIQDGRKGTAANEVFFFSWNSLITFFVIPFIFSQEAIFGHTKKA